MRKSKNKIKITQKEIDMIRFDYTDGKIKIEDSFEYYHLLQDKWARDLGLKNGKDLNYEQQEIFRKLYCIWKWKLQAQEMIDEAGWEMGQLASEIQEKENNFNKHLVQIAKHKSYMGLESRVQNYDIIADLMLGIQKIENKSETYKTELSKEAQKNEEFIKSYVANNDDLFKLIKTMRCLMGKEI